MNASPAIADVLRDVAALRGVRAVHHVHAPPVQLELIDSWVETNERERYLVRIFAYLWRGGTLAVRFLGDVYAELELETGRAPTPEEERELAGFFREEANRLGDA